MEILTVALQSALSIAVLFLLAKLIGNRQISQLSLFDYINSITIGSIAAELATSLEEWYKPLTAMVVYGVVTALISWVTCKSMAVRRFVNGTPLILFENGSIKKQNLLKSLLDMNEFLTQCRVAGYFDLDELEAAVLETNGGISFLPKASKRPATPEDLALKPERASIYATLILDGHILDKNLKQTGHDEAWLREQLHTAGIGQVREVFFACCDANGNFRTYRKPQGSEPDRSVFE